MTPTQRLKELGIELPVAPAPKGAYVPCLRHGDTLYVSGMLPLEAGVVKYTGLLGHELNVEQGAAAARLCALNALAVVQQALDNGLDDVAAVLRLNGFLASAPDFTDQPAALNGASQLMADVFGDAGVHTRTAVGAAVLPLNAACILDMILAVK